MELPVQFKEEMIALLQDGQAEELFQSIGTEPVVSIRLNTTLLPRQDLIGKLQGMQIDGDVPWARNGLYLKGRPLFTSDPLFHAGCYYVQEASSMFLEQAVKRCVNGPVKVLDLCAAPGGKSTHLCSLLPEGSLMVANEINRSRANILAENMIKWGRPGTMVTNDTPERIGGSTLSFDIILADVPCSGEGMFRKDTESVKEWSVQNVRMCADRQQSILKDIWPALKPGGFIIYSTCTYNTFEDEDNVAWLIDEFNARPINIEVPGTWNVMGDLSGRSMPVYHFMPHRTRGEGFFISLLQKPGDHARTSVQRSRNSHKNADGIFRDWIKEPGKYLFDVRGNSVYALPSVLSEQMLQVSDELNTLVPGLEVASMKGRDWIPSHPLAMSTELCEESFVSTSLTHEQALSYLHLDALRLENCEKGVVMVKYDGVPLGFVKNIGSRANNLYPQHWRIRRQMV